jgi:hypothetical protein
MYRVLQILKRPVILQSYNKVFDVNNADRIHEHLFLGNVEASKDEYFLKTFEIGAIVNCTENEPFAPYFDQKPKLHIPVKDSRDDANKEMFYQYLKESSRFIKEEVDKKNVVFVHCYWGVMRSATVVAVHLMDKYGFTPQGAIEYVKAKRPRALSSLYNFNDLIQKYYEEEILTK